VFEKGKSGNPSGRPHGETPQMRIRREIEAEMPGILGATIEAAKAGDMSAVKILMDKIVPNVKPQAFPVVVKPGANAVETGDNIILETLSGRLSADIGVALISMLTAQAKAIETDDLAKRVAALESERES
jgi:Family of unknown function (DUF5681)